jgi:hypothetical protein
MKLLKQDVLPSGYDGDATYQYEDNPPISVSPTDISAKVRVSCQEWPIHHRRLKGIVDLAQAKARDKIERKMNECVILAIASNTLNETPISPKDTIHGSVIAHAIGLLNDRNIPAGKIVASPNIFKEIKTWYNFSPTSQRNALLEGLYGYIQDVPIYLSSQMSPRLIFVVGPPETLGVMPIWDPLSATLVEGNPAEENCLMGKISTTIGAAILNEEAIVKVILPPESDGDSQELPFLPDFSATIIKEEGPSIIRISPPA